MESVAAWPVCNKVSTMFYLQTNKPPNTTGRLGPDSWAVATSQSETRAKVGQQSANKNTTLVHVLPAARTQTESFVSSTWPRGKVLSCTVSRRTTVRFRFGSLFPSEVVVCGHLSRDQGVALRSAQSRDQGVALRSAQSCDQGVP